MVGMNLWNRYMRQRQILKPADSLIRQYMGFIRAEAAKYLHRAPIEGQDEELSIVLLAFYEAILGYEKNRGAFLAYASRGIRSRLIDYYRERKKACRSNITARACQ